MRSTMYVVKLVFLFISVKWAQAKDLCTYEDPIKSCKCYFDGQHFVVDCARTYMSALPHPNEFPKDVEVLDVSYNDINQLRFEDANFESKTLRIFRASYNNINAVTNTFLNSLPHLTYLDLSHNVITQLESQLFTNVPSLHYLDLSFNAIQKLPDRIFVPMRNLRYLDLSYNNIGEQLLTYKSLNLSDLGFNENLQTLKLDATNLTCFSNQFFDNLTLTHVSLADNSMKEVPLLPSTLITLDLSGNYFNSIAPRHLTYTQLKTLHLNRLGYLVTLENYAFYNLIALETLEIEHCSRLTSFNDKAFGVLLEKEHWNLTRISLNGNALKQMNETYFHLFNKVNEVDLSNNPWICDCGVKWIQLVKPHLINQRNMRCVAPRRLRNMEIMELNDKTLPRCNVKSNMRVQKILTSIICILVVLLLGIIMYLIYLAPFKGNQSDRFIGSESPYSNMVIRGDEHFQL